MSFYPPLDPVVITDNGVECMYYRRDGRLVHLWPSNFFVRPLYIMGYTVPSNEHWYQAMKSLVREEREAVLAAATPGESKRMGRQITLRPDWESVKNSVMWTGLHEKFAPATDLAEALVATGDVLIVEGNTHHDNVWGNCTCGRKACEGDGENRLGRMLMRRREMLRSI